ncbi:MAG: hypothetical protein JSS02_07535 [Planctomycetes bacterium]|nr:hypothetical protein [Planctomycetota bacterium]
MSIRVHSWCQSAVRLLVICGIIWGVSSGSGLSVAWAQAGAPAGQAAVAPGTSLARFLPANAVGFAEVSGIGKFVRQLEQADYVRLLMATPQFKEFEKTPDFQKAVATRKIVEAQLGMDVFEAAEKLLGGRVAMAVYPQAGNPAGSAVVVLKGANPEVLAQVRQRVEPFFQLADAKVDTDTVAGAKLYTVNGQAFIAWGDTWVAAAGTRDLLSQTLQLLSGKEQGGVAADEEFRAMSRDMGSDYPVRGFVNTALLTKLKGSRLLPAKLDNPVVSMLAGGAVELAANSPYLGLSVEVRGNRFVLTSRVAGDSRKLDEAHRVFFSDPAGPGMPDLPALPGLISGFSLHLDLANWYRQREALLEPQLLPAFDQFETGIGNLLPGKDVGEDIVPLIGRNFTIVAAPQDYSHIDGKPGIQLPGFAVLIDLAKPEEGGDLFQLFFQTLSAILNLASAQQKHEPWVMKSESYKDVQITYGRYLKKPSGDQLPIVFNFMPAAARVGNRFIISSSVATCRQLIDALKSSENAAAPRLNRNMNLELNADALAGILDANRQVFVARSIQQGANAVQAEAEFSAVLQVVRFFQSLRLSSQVLPEGFQLQFEGSWK